MSSCFLCDCSYKFTEDGDVHYVAYNNGDGGYEPKQFYIKQLPIMVGSSGTDVDDQQHNNNNKQNYVSYRVKKIEFCCSYNIEGVVQLGFHGKVNHPDYVLIFKVPFREPIFDYGFLDIKRFMLYSEPECVLDYKVLQVYEDDLPHEDIEEYEYKHPLKFNININKPFIVGPNDYVGVLYMFTRSKLSVLYVDASARVWFDVV